METGLASEPVQLPTPPTTATALSSPHTRQQQQQNHLIPRRELSSRNRSSQPGTVAATVPRDPQNRRTPPDLGQDGERSQGNAALARGGGGVVGGAAAARARAAKPKTRLSPGTIPKPLLPVTERKSQEENVPGGKEKKASADEDKWDIAPDGTSAGREGRQFTVWNVGNNGRIYLRYVCCLLLGSRLCVYLCYAHKGHI